MKLDVEKKPDHLIYYSVGRLNVEVAEFHSLDIDSFNI